jgi:TonB family protein
MRVFTISLLGSILSSNLMGGAVQSASLAATSDAPEYPDSEGGLKKLLENIFSAVTAHDEGKMSSYFSGLKIPGHGAWFAKTFGPSEGARLDAKYAEMLPEENNQIKKMFDYALKEQRTIVDVSAIHKSDEIMGLWRAVMQAMVQPATLYRASGRNPKQKFDVALGDFVYVDGGFRYVDTQVWQALSSAPPLRVRIGGNVAKQSLVNKVQPIYPEEAKAARIQGTVRIHIILATDGTVKEMTLVDGDRTLAKAAIEAVKQWRYRPTSLNGIPVEVDSTVDVVFSLVR